MMNEEQVSNRNIDFKPFREFLRNSISVSMSPDICLKLTILPETSNLYLRHIILPWNVVRAGLADQLHDSRLVNLIYNSFLISIR